MQRPKCSFLNRVLNYIKELDLLKKDDSVLIALSGGADSVSLFLFFYYHIKDIYNIKLGAAHLNHGLRGKESDQDEIYCKNICEKHNIPLFSKKIKISKQKKNSPEDTYRRVRYDYLNQISKKEAYNKIATAHHMEDQIETIFMRMLSGTGISGLMGIRPVRDNIIRPFLTVSKNELLDYLKYLKQPFRFDSSNNDTDFLRNRIRHKIMPCIEKNMNKSYKKSIIKLSNNIFKEYASLDYFVENLKENIIMIDSKFFLEIDFFEKQTELVQKKLVDSILKDLSCPVTNYAVFNSFKQILKKKTGSKLDINDDITIERSYKKIIFYKKKQKSEKQYFEKSIPKKEGIYLYENKKIKVSFLENNKFLNYPDADEPRALFDSNKIGNTVIIRRRRQGDLFFPLGAPGIKKLKSFFINKKIPSYLRDSYLLFESQKKIIWVAGLRISELSKVDKNSLKLVEVSIVN